MENAVRISIADAQELIVSLLRANGVSDDCAIPVAAALVAAEAEGQVGHGFSRLDDYIAQVRSGKINAQAKITSRLTSQTSVLTNADCGFAYPALDRAIEWGAKIAKTQGTSTMSVFNSHHCGILSLQVEKLAQQGLVGIMMANAPKAIAPWGASVPVYGTNPIAFAAPRKNSDPLVIDLSLSKVARGKVMHAKKTGQPIPEGWALDKAGKPTTHAQDALDGSMLPIGGAKGTSLALMVEIMATTFAGGMFSKDASSFFTPNGSAPRVGQFLIAINPGQHSGPFLDRLEELLDHITQLDGARLPGERRLECRKNAREHGLLVPSQYLRSAGSLARPSVP